MSTHTKYLYWLTWSTSLMLRIEFIPTLNSSCGPVDIKLHNLPDAVGGPLEVVVPPCFHEGQMQSLGGRLDMIRGECRGWTKYRHDSWLDEVTQLFTCLQVMSNFQFHKWPKIIIFSLWRSRLQGTLRCPCPRWTCWGWSCRRSPARSPSGKPPPRSLNVRQIMRLKMKLH